ncbi:MAG: Wzz/FepE/Etk N-terminal domain-containing protein [Bacillota bacterium]
MAEPAEPPRQTSLLRVAAAVASRWRLILVCGLVGGALTAAYALAARPRYRATAKFALEERTLNPSAASGLAALAGQLGAGSLGGTRSLQFYADVIVGRDVLTRVALDSFPDPADRAHRRALLDILHIGGPDSAHRVNNAVDYLSSRAVGTTTNDRTGTITLNVTLPDAQLAADVAGRLYAHLEQFNYETRRSAASERRRFAERELVTARGKLSEAEGAMRAFLEANRAGVMDIPRLAFQREQLQRRIELLTEEYGRLARELQDAQMDEVRDTPVFTLVQAPVAPVYRDFPRRTRMTITGAILAGALAVAWAAFKATGWSVQQLDPAGYAQFRSSLRRRRSA